MIQTKKRKIFSNTIYTILGALVLNGVLQLLVYPSLNREMGAAGYGTVLYVMAFVNILGPSVGQALNNSRLVVRRDKDVTNGDYNLMLLLLSAVGTVGTLVIAHGELTGVGSVLLTTALIFLTVFRYYGDVEYRLSLNYRKYFIYYTLCGVGYAAGYGIYRLTGNWYVIFLTGEAAALCFVAVTGGIFRSFFARSPYFKDVASRGSILVLSYFITNLTLNIDRIYLQHALGSEAVSQYYVVSLIGKTLVLFIAPINTILISYLTKDKKRITRNVFLQLSGAGLLVAAAFFLLCQIGTPIFVRLFYPDLADAVTGLVTTANLTQILAMLSAYLFIIVLTIANEKWQLVLQTIHLVLVLVLISVITPRGGIVGFSYALLAANAIRVCLILALGLWKSNTEKTASRE